jgi:type I restriction enzyme S subunit
MPNHWRLTTLGEAAEVEMGQSPPGDTYNSNGDGLPFLQGSAEFGERFPSPDRWCSAPTRVAEPGDLLVSVRAPVGDTNFADTRLAIGRGLARVRTTSVASADFLRFVIQSEVGRLNQNAGGGMFASITAKNLRGFQITLPPIPEQRRIADLIGSIDSYIDSLKIQVEATRTARSALLAELLSNSGDDWQRTALGGAAEVNPKEPPLPEDAPFVPMDAVNAGQRWVGYTEQRGRRSGARARAGDVLFARITPCLENGKTAQVQPEIERCGGSTEFIVLRGSDRLDPDFLYFWATDRSVRMTAASLMTGSTGRQRLSAKDLAAMELDLPPIAEQRRIVDIVESVDEQADSLESLIDSAQLVRAGVLTELLSGERLLDEAYDMAVSP